MPKNGYDGPTWEELAEGGMSPSRIEATLAEHGFYDDEEEKSDIPRHMRLFNLSGYIQDILDNAKFKVEDSENLIMIGRSPSLPIIIFKPSKSNSTIFFPNLSEQ